ncbi:MAG: response regulator, partial [Xenococcaceae cyanobacterium]
MKILVVEDDQLIAKKLKAELKHHKYVVELAADGEIGWQLAEVFEYDLIILDIIMPNLDGLSLCKRLRAHGKQMPILLLTGDDNAINKIQGLDVGADDYVVKPYDLDELLARMRALLRRQEAILPPVLEWRNLQLDPNIHEVKYNGQLLSLTCKEYCLLELFLRHSRRIFSQNSLVDLLWSFEELPEENTVRSHIRGLRKKLKKAGAPPDFIETIYGVGYRLKTFSDSDKPNELKQLPLRASTPKYPVEQQIMAEFADIWQECQAQLSDRLAVLEEAVNAWQNDNLSLQMLQRANQEAHTLAGTLGTIGLNHSSSLAVDIKRLFQNQEISSQEQLQHLAEMIMTLSQELKQYAIELPTQTLPILEQQFTGVIDHNRFIQELTQLMHLANRHHRPLSLGAIEIEHWSQINTQYSHSIREQILSCLGEHLKLQFRREDLVAPWQGKAFVVSLYGMTKKEGIKRLRKIVESLKLEELYLHNGKFRVTFSVGVAQYPQDGVNLQALYQTASNSHCKVS